MHIKSSTPWGSVPHTCPAYTMPLHKWRNSFSFVFLSRAAGTPDEIDVWGLGRLGCTLEQVIKKLHHILEGISEDAAHVAQHIHSGSAIQLLQIVTSHLAE